MDEDIKIELTGNPFVDAGLGVIAAIAKLDDINELTLSHLTSVFNNGEQLARWNSKLTSFTQVFGTNNPLFQTAYGFKKGQGPSGTNRAIYRSMVWGLLSAIETSANGPRCWACGTPSDFDFAQICKKAIEDNGKKSPEDKWIGRDCFPLAGSLGSDAQALPCASESPHICPKCLFAIHYVPMGLILLNSKPAVFQCPSTSFWYELVRDITMEVQARINCGNYETLGKKEKNRAVMIRLLALFERLKKNKSSGEVPQETSLYAWRFSNSGQSPECSTEEIPNQAILFLRNAVDMGLRSEIESLVNLEGKNPYHSLFRCILDKRDYFNLYPEGRRLGASPELFFIYQTCVCNHSISALRMAYQLAKEISGQVSEKELKRIQRPEAFKEEKIRNQFRASMIMLAENGELTLEDYLDLFPKKETSGITVEWGGWNLVRFYLHHTNESDKPKLLYPPTERPLSNYISYYAGVIYNHYISEKGVARFQREVLGQIGLGKVGVRWLRNQFTQLAESEDAFTYNAWSKLCKLDDGRLFVSELLFQMRLLWTQWIHEGRTLIDNLPIAERKSTDALPEQIKTLIEAIFIDYISRRELERFHRDILLRLRRKEIGLFWFKEKVIKQISEDIQPLTEEEWEHFLVDDEGQSAKTERLFQLHLALANLYRVKKLNV